MYVPNYQITELSSPYYYEGNTKQFQMLHCLSIHRSRSCLLQDGTKHVAFESESEALMFLKDPVNFGAPKVSYNEVIRYSGDLVIFVDSNNSAWHAGASSVPYKGYKYLNRRSIGIALLRNANKPPEDQYTYEQYETLAHRILTYNPEFPLVDNLVLHRDASPERRTDPDHFNFDMFLDAVHRIK